MLFSDKAFKDFGPLSLARDGTSPTCQTIEGQRTGDLRRQVRLLCPTCPGVYGMVDEQGELIYVGKAKRLRPRLLSYFRARGRPRKAGRIVALTKLLAWERCPSEFAALLRELELIRRWASALQCSGATPAQPESVCVPRPPASSLRILDTSPARKCTFDYRPDCCWAAGIECRLPGQRSIWTARLPASAGNGFSRARRTLSPGKTGWLLALRDRHLSGAVYRWLRQAHLHGPCPVRARLLDRS